MPQLSSYLDEKCVYRNFTPLSSNQHIKLEKRCEGGESVKEFYAIVQSIADLSWTQILLAEYKLERYNKEGNGIYASGHSACSSKFLVEVHCK